MTKIAKVIIEILLIWVMIVYAPIYYTACILHIIARLLLSLAYLGMLDYYMAKNVFISVFTKKDIYGRY